jgi:hypothetical protein
MSMSRKEKIRITRQMDGCAALGLSRHEHDALRRASMRLQRWGEMECNHDVQRDEVTNKVTVRYCRNDGNISKPRAIRDMETPAIKRCEAIAKAHGLAFYHQSDPRGVQVYIGKTEDLRGMPIDQAYSRLLAVY